MSASLKTAGTWARMVTDGGTVAIPGSPAAGNRMFLYGTWKTFSITVADPSGWTPIGTVFADGSTAAGNGSGSVDVMAWYRDWQSGDAAPAIDYSAAPTEGLWVIQLWQKDASDVWDTPLTATGAIAAADPFSVDASSTLDILDGAAVSCLIGLRDDSLTIARATDAIDDTGGLVTWNGNYVESPATHISSTTGLDMSADLGHRLVTTGATGVMLHADGDIVASESGSAKFVIIRAALPATDFTPGPIVVQASVPAPTFETPRTFAPAAVSAITVVPAPTFETSGGATEFAPAPVIAATTVLAPTFETPRTFIPAPIAVLAAVPAPTFAPELIFAPDPVAAVTALPSPSLETVVTFAPDPVAAGTAVPAPTLASELTFAPAPVIAATSVPAPTFEAEGGPQTFAPGPIVASLALPAPTFAPSLTFAPDPIIIATAVPAPGLDLVYGFAPDPLIIATSIPVPTFESTGGVITFTPAAVTMATVVPAPAFAWDRSFAPAPIALLLSLPAIDFSVGTPESPPGPAAAAIVTLDGRWSGSVGLVPTISAEVTRDA